MTTELEEQFFKTFGVEPECSIEDVKNVKCVEKKCKDCIFCMKPEITAEILLEMICILNKEGIYGYSDWGGNFVIGETVEELKESILTDCIRDKSKIFKQIQQLFKEGE